MSERYVCGVCRKERKLDQLQEGTRRCIDVRRCQKIALNNMVGTPAQGEAKQLRRRELTSY